MYLAVFVCLNILTVPIAGDACKLVHETENGKEVPVEPGADHVAYAKLKPFIGKRFTATDTENKFRYTVGICEPAGDGPSYKNVGVIQHNLGDVPKDRKPEYVVGRYDATQLMSGNDWIMLEYWNGDKYGSHCNSEPRKANILIICNEQADDENPGMKLLEENNGRNSDCYYLFELSHKMACGDAVILKSSLSVGSIILIVLSSALILYLLLGFLYQRFVLHAKGMNQFPNYSFWQDFGNLQADGCSLICRSLSSTKPATYKGLGDEQLEEDLDTRDDHLLPM